MKGLKKLYMLYFCPTPLHHADPYPWLTGGTVLSKRSLLRGSLNYTKPQPKSLIPPPPPHTDPWLTVGNVLFKGTVA